MTTTRHLTVKQLEELGRELRNELARSERSMTARATSEASMSPHDRVLQSPPQAEGGLAVMLETRALGRHQRLEDALHRLDVGRYGRCLRCDRPIPYGRLLVVPETTHCVTCRPGG
jgi:DnaK suppressor protein